ncbi:MAG: phospholipid-binding protein MlaC [Parvularculaceae bacterium]
MMSILTVTRRWVAAGAAVLALAATPARADQAAEDYVQSILDEAYVALNVDDEDAMLDALADLVDKYVDERRAALFTLGQYARRITDEQRAEFIPLFKEYATTVYQDALANYSGERLVVTDSVDRSARDIIVNSEIANAKPGDQWADVTVHWRVYRNRNGVMSVLDAGAEGVWLAIEQRSQFTSVIANNGGGEKGMDALITQLREQVEGR